MAALLAICTFAAFILIDYLLTVRARRRATEVSTGRASSAVPERALETAPRFEPVWVAGYELPEHLHYHRGHTWARVLDEDTAAVGLDDFARKFLGSASGIDLPRVGSYVRQGGTGARIRSSGRKADVVSPVDGEVVAVNPALEKDPELATRDPYGRGWLYRIRSTNLKAALRNLLSGTLARRWTEDAREQLEVRLMALSGSVLQDGGEPAPGFSRHLSDDDWDRLVERFFLTPGRDA